MRRILLTVAYDGTNYYGWQKQINPWFDTIEERLEKALRKLFKSKILTCTGASRTDKGVHAMGQKVTIDVESSIPAENIPMAILGYLPNDIVIVEAKDVPLDFHPRYDCVKKTYEYTIINQKYRDPFKRLYGVFIYGDFDIESMNIASKQFIGKKDFKAFCTDGNEIDDTVREVYDCSVRYEDNRIIISVTGSGFLYHMVRTIAGTLIGVGQGKIDAYSIESTIESKDRQKAFYTAEARGLMLKEIFY